MSQLGSSDVKQAWLMSAGLAHICGQLVSQLVQIKLVWPWLAGTTQLYSAWFLILLQVTLGLFSWWWQESKRERGNMHATVLLAKASHMAKL